MADDGNLLDMAGLAVLPTGELREIHDQEVTRDDRVCPGDHELPPGRPGTPGRWLDGRGVQDLPASVLLLEEARLACLSLFVLADEATRRVWPITFGRAAMCRRYMASE
jgi:hypothetical protein